MGGFFGLTTSATSTPAQFDWFVKLSVPSGLAYELTRTSRCLQHPLFCPRWSHAILCNQRIEDQSAIDTAEHRGFL